ncbi:hypothetical protein Tco_1556971 [Tanacetum coccineum]
MITTSSKIGSKKPSGLILTPMGIMEIVIEQVAARSDMESKMAELTAYGDMHEINYELESLSLYALDIIVNRDLQEEPAPTGDQSGPFAPPVPKTTKQLAAKRKQERVKSILLLAIPDEYLLKVYEDEMKRSSSSTSNSQNLAFLSFENTSRTNKVSTASGNFHTLAKWRFLEFFCTTTNQSVQLKKSRQRFAKQRLMKIRPQKKLDLISIGRCATLYDYAGEEIYAEALGRRRWKFLKERQHVGILISHINRVAIIHKHWSQTMAFCLGNMPK